MGLDLTTSIRMFLCQMVHDKRLPFNPNLDSLYANNVAKIKEGLEQISKGQGIEKTLEDLRELEK